MIVFNVSKLLHKPIITYPTPTSPNTIQFNVCTYLFEKKFRVLMYNVNSIINSVKLNLNLICLTYRLIIPIIPRIMAWDSYAINKYVKVLYLNLLISIELTK